MNGSGALVSDLVVVVPGIQGTQLYKDGKPIWALSGKGLWKGLRTLGKNVKSLALPDGVGDENPGDKIEPCGLMPDLHGIPGIGPHIGGYADLSRWLQRTVGLQPATPDRAGNLLEFGYDWRLSNRYNARRLKEVAERELTRWKREGHESAQLIFYCHSMGGLIARYYLEVLEGGEHTRSLVTVGTPHRGSLKALVNLVNGVRIDFGLIKLPASELARTFPSAHQLLPTYRCIDVDETRYGLLDKIPAQLDRTMVEDALAFHGEIHDAREANGESPYNFRMVVGTRQPTHATARLAGDGVEPLWTIDGDERRGDGTVPRFASIPDEIEPADLRQLSSGQRHGWLQQNAGTLDDLHGILTAEPIRYMAEPPILQRQPGIEMPELADPDEDLIVRASSAADDLLLFATLCDEEGAPRSKPRHFDNREGGEYRVNLGRPPEGVSTVRVSGRPTAGIEPVVEAVLVTKSEPAG